MQILEWTVNQVRDSVQWFPFWQLVSPWIQASWFIVLFFTVLCYPLWLLFDWAMPRGPGVRGWVRRWLDNVTA